MENVNVNQGNSKKNEEVESKTKKIEKSPTKNKNNNQDNQEIKNNDKEKSPTKMPINKEIVKDKSISPIKNNKPKAKSPVKSNQKNGRKRKQSSDFEDDDVNEEDNFESDFESDESSVKGKKLKKLKNKDSNKEKTKSVKQPRKIAEKQTKEIHIKDNTIITGPLNNLTFVITGETDFYLKGRDDLRDILVGLGGRVTTTVSKKTKFLITGEKLIDNRPIEEGNKYKKAKDNNVTIINYAELTDLLSEKLNDKYFNLNNFTLADAYAKTNPLISDTTHEVTKLDPEKSYLRKKENLDENNSTVLNEVEMRDASEVNNILWTNRFSPTSIEEIVGNKDGVNKIIEWLNDWDDVVIYGNKKESKESFRGNIA